MSKSILDIYTDYKVMPQLQEHQLRVAAVAQQLCTPALRVNTDHVMTACLVHDMANIIKFDLKVFPEFLQPQGLGYWQGVRQAYIDTYGPDEHRASLKIAADLGLAGPVVDLIRMIGFPYISEVTQSGDLERKICCYADQRVAPYGVATIQQRLDEGRKRYAHRTDHKLNLNFEIIASDLVTLESQVLAATNLLATDITDASIKNNFLALKAYQIT